MYYKRISNYFPTVSKNKEIIDVVHTFDYFKVKITFLSIGYGIL